VKNITHKKMCIISNSDNSMNKILAVHIYFADSIS
jgi:hypothetical protein